MIKEFIKKQHCDLVLLDFIDFAYKDNHKEEDFENYIYYFQNNVEVLNNLLDTLDNIIFSNNDK